MILSFAETTPALLAGAKTVTRREWHPNHARKFTAGALVQAWDKTPRVKGAKRVGTIRLTASPVLESTSLLRPEDWADEGFEYMTEHDQAVFGERPLDVWLDWVTRPRDLWVVRFELVGVVGS